MCENNYLKMLVEEIHSATVATIGMDGHPQTRTIDMIGEPRMKVALRARRGLRPYSLREYGHVMLWDENGVYFLTAKGKAFYTQLMEQKYIALSATKDKKSVSLRGRIRNIGSEKLDEIFEKNTYMQAIYPSDTRSALEVFQLYEASGEYFDISDPSHVTRDSIVIGQPQAVESGYFVGEKCIGCKLCYSVCPQKCIDISTKPVVIDQSRCLHCGRCAEICPKQTIEKRG
ncbi:MAG: 4Fe-4S binding protein [Lachnospiraceae bacterium]|nr:4Fe-4S binding protein [Lachnospiraceae bacterium]